MTNSILIKHNIEVAHLLFESPVKCENIHGHSMWVELELHVPHGMDRGMFVNSKGHRLEFGDVKRVFRGFLDEKFDHHLLLNNADPFASLLGLGSGVVNLPGLVTMMVDPTTENIAKWIAEFCAHTYMTDASVTVQETSVNAAKFTQRYLG